MAAGNFFQGRHIHELTDLHCHVLRAIMSGVTPYRTLHDIARALPELTRREDIEAALDELEYLFEVIPPEMQEYAEPIIEALRIKLAAVSD
jgi:hypothetical protein